jgi:hypothetical protein
LKIILNITVHYEELKKRKEIEIGTNHLCRLVQIKGQLLFKEEIIAKIQK